MPKKPLKIKYSDLYGLREEKYKFLESRDVKNTDWQEIELKEPYFWFVPKEPKREGMYEKFVSAKDIFEEYNRGVVTSRDNFVIGDIDDLRRNLSIFINKNLSDETVRGMLKLKDTKGWNLSRARERIIRNGIQEKLFVNYCYRPFDNKKIYYDDLLLERSRKEIMSHMLKNNLGLLLMRQAYWKNYNHIFIANKITDSRIFISNRGAADIFPLYLYNKNATQKSIFKDQSHLDLAGVQKELDEYSDNKKSNIKAEIINKLSGLINKTVSPEEIFYYIYAVLYSNTYRQKYNEFLKIDFPRIPFTKDAELFNKLAKLGEELVNLHLLKSEKLENVSAKFPIIGDNRVKFRKYSEKESRLYINNAQYFEGIKPEIWNYYIGGYQILDKWLKDRVDKVLSAEDVNHFLKIITVLKLTIELQKEIDELYPEIEKDLM